MRVDELLYEISELNRNIGAGFADENFSLMEEYQNRQETLTHAFEVLESNGYEMVDKLIVSNIKWVTDGEDVDLPKKVIIDINLDNIDLLEDIDGYADNLSDYLSDTYEYCHDGFSVKVSPAPIKKQAISR